MRRRAFSLVELLVVVTILALLAALLFPVFAQARASARATANLSNVRQNAGGVLLYVTDHQDVFPLVVRFNDPVKDASGATIAAYTPWQEAIHPYSKSRAINVSPLEASPSGATPAAERVQSYFYYGVVPRSSWIGNRKRDPDSLVVYCAPGSMGCGYVDGPFGYSIANGPSTPSRAASEIVRPSEAIMISDAGRFDMGILASENGDGTSATPPEGGKVESVHPTSGPCFLVSPSAPPGWPNHEADGGPWARKNGDRKTCHSEPGAPRGRASSAAADGSAQSMTLSQIYETGQIVTGTQMALKRFFTGVLK